ncbi:MAG: class I SAM-dependent methyltransferase [Bacteroidota bacterium]|nr:class I SAM-dependent methyltransferase [Bacteroidota bacterium]
MNYFSHKNTAERYAKGRPFFHRNTINHFAEFTQVKNKFENALDVACGTGLSTNSLLDIAENVFGIDVSDEMLKLALNPQEIKYSKASAENLPFKNNYFDIVTVSSGVHWFDIDQFLREAKRVLKSKSWLVLYENHFISEIPGVEIFSNWFPNIYLKKFPSPKRNNNYEWTGENLKDKGFTFIKEERFKNAIEFSKEQLILYFTTQSNITAAVENKVSAYEEIENWLDKELTPFFLNEQRRTINYGNWIKYLQKIN